MCFPWCFIYYLMWKNLMFYAMSTSSPPFFGIGRIQVFYWLYWKKKSPGDIFTMARWICVVYWIYICFSNCSVMVILYFTSIFTCLYPSIWRYMLIKVQPYLSRDGSPPKSTQKVCDTFYLVDLNVKWRSLYLFVFPNYFCCTESVIEAMMIFPPIWWELVCRRCD